MLVCDWRWARPVNFSYLCFSQHQRCGHFKAFGSGQVFVELELVLQLQQLLTGESSAGPPALAQQAGLRASCSARDRHTIVISCDNTSHPKQDFLIWFRWMLSILYNFKMTCNGSSQWSAHNVIYLRARTWEVQRHFSGVWDMQAHICPHSAAIINYNGFPWVYCWRVGEQGRSGRAGHKSRGMPLT